MLGLVFVVLVANDTQISHAQEKPAGGVPRHSDAWSPVSVHPDWELVTRLQRVPLFDQKLPADVDLASILRHEQPLVRLTAAATILRSEQVTLYDQVLELCRDDWKYVADSSLQLLMSMRDKHRNRRLIDAASFPDWETWPTSEPYRQVLYAVELPSDRAPDTYWQWHDHIENLRAQVRAGQQLERADHSDDIFGGTATTPAVICLDRSIVVAGETITCRVRRHKNSNFDIRINGNRFALEYGQINDSGGDWYTIPDPLIVNKGWPQMRLVRGIREGESIVEVYEITLPASCFVGNYSIGRNAAYFRVLRSPADEERLPTLVTGDLKQLFEAICLRSELAIGPVQQRLDQMRVAGEFRDNYWDALSSIGSEEAVEVLLREPSYVDYDVLASPRRAIAATGIVAHKPALAIVRDWQNRELESLELAFSVLGPNALKNEHAMMQQIARGQIQQIRRLQQEVDRKRRELEAEDPAIAARTDGGYSVLGVEYSKASTEYHQRVDLLTTVLSKFREDQREFVLTTLLEVASELEILTRLIPNAFLRADAPWISDQLWRQVESHPDGQSIGKAMALGFARARVTGKSWLRSLDFPITNDEERIWFERSTRPELQAQVDRRVREYEAAKSK